MVKKYLDIDGLRHYSKRIKTEMLTTDDVRGIVNRSMKDMEPQVRDIVNKVLDEHVLSIKEADDRGKNESMYALVITNVSDSSNTVTLTGPAAQNTFEKSTDGIAWAAWAPTTANNKDTFTATVAAGESLYIRGTNNTTMYGFGFSFTQDVVLSGNVLALLSQAKVNSKVLTEGDEFHYLFRGCTQIVEIESGLLPATELAPYCYAEMFNYCTGLTTLPSGLLPATELKEGCYASMFSGCTGLTTLPSGLLPATELKEGCYAEMFSGCTGLTTLPSGLLPATELAPYCYQDMFSNCTKLKQFELSMKDPALSAFADMFSECYSLRHIIVEYDVQMSKEGILEAVGSPENARVVYNQQTMPLYIEDKSGKANTLTIRRNGGSATLTVKYKAVTDGVCDADWTTLGTVGSNPVTLQIPKHGRVYLCAETTSWNYFRINCQYNFAVGGNILSLLYGENFNGQNEFGDTIGTYTFSKLFYGSNIVDVKKLLLPATELAPYCYTEMFYGCTGLTSLPSGLLPATELAPFCYAEMFYGCTGLTSLPSGLLPATELATYCYQDMFYGCTGLTSLPSGLLPATELKEGCYIEMFVGCTSLTSLPSGTFVELDSDEGGFIATFAECSNITSIYIDATTPPMYIDTLAGVPTEGITISVPNGCGNTYKQAEGWGEFADCIVERNA